jgi:hypothetical protein
MPPPSAAAQLRQLDAMSEPYQEEPSRGRGTTGVNLPGTSVDGDEGLGTKQTTLEEAGSEFLKGTGQGVVGAAPMLAGAVTGGRLGAMAAPFTGPAAPFIPAAGAIVGAGVGAYTGKSLEDLYNDAFPMTNKEDASIYRRGGQAFGSAIAMAPGAFMLPVMTANRVSRFISGIGEAARKYPKTFLFGELHGGLGAGLGAMAAESEYPGEAGPAFVGEVAGGVLSPSRWLTNGTVSAIDALRTMRSTYSQDARQTRAAEYLQRILEEGGENIPKLVTRLQENITGPKGKPITPTAAQKTGSLPLTMLERMLSKKLPEYAGENLEQGQQALKAYGLLIENMKKIGTPDAFQEAAKLEKMAFENTLAGEIQRADQRSAKAIVKINQDTPASRRAIGDIVKNNTEGALRNAREYESALWEDATKKMMIGTAEDGKVPTIAPKNTLLKYLDLVAETTPEFRKDLIPNSISEIASRFGANRKVALPDEPVLPDFKGAKAKKILESRPTLANVYTAQKLQGTLDGPDSIKDSIVATPISVKDLLNLRSNALKLAREYDGNGNVNAARLMGEVAESVLEDITGSAQRAKAPEAVDAFNSARQFSRSLNDAFTRTFAAQATQTAPGAVTKTGSEKLPAEILVSRAFGSNADVTAMRMEDIMDATKLLKTTYDDVVNRFGRDSAQAQQLKPFYDQGKEKIGGTTDAIARAMRLAAADSIDVTTGKLDPKKLAKFVYGNKPVLDKLGVTNDLTDAVTAENAFRAVTERNSKLMQEAASQSAWAQVLKNENPVRSLADVLSGKTPIKGVQNMAKMAAANGPEAVKGLKSTLYDYAFEKAGGVDNFSPTKFYSIMFDEIQPNGPSLVNIMRTQGLMTAQEGNNFKRLIYPMQRIEKSMESKQMLSDDAENMQDMAVALGLRIMGSGLGRGIQQLAPGGGGGASMVAASAGSKYLRDMVQKMPKVFVKQIIQEATQDPELMARLLTQPKTQVERFRMARSLHSYLAAAGLNFATFDEQEPQEPRPTGPSSSQMLRSLPPAPPTTGLPGILGGPTKPAAPKTGGAPAPQSGANFQSLFPFDSISPMLAARQQPQQPQQTQQPAPA